jgi:hypothetical protein
MLRLGWRWNHGRGRLRATRDGVVARSRAQLPSPLEKKVPSFFEIPAGRWPFPFEKKTAPFLEKDDAIGRVQRELFARSLRLNIHT